MTVNIKTLQKLLSYFDGDMHKARVWLETPNPMLNDMRPNEMRTLGKHKNLDEYIDSLLDEKRERA